MKQAIGKLGLAALLAVGMTGVFARPAHDWQGDAGARLERQLEWARASQARRGGEEGGGRGRGRDEGGGGGGREERQFRDGPQQQDGYWQQPDQGRRGGRMSPEERRELRRQIDEAGRNIYAPRR